MTQQSEETNSKRKGIPTEYIEKAMSGINISQDIPTSSPFNVPSAPKTAKKMLFFDIDKNDYVPISADLVDTNSLPQKYPPSLPTEKIKVAYHDTELDAIEVYTLAEESLRAGQMPSLPVTTHCVYYLTQRLKFPTRFAGRAGKLRSWEVGEDLSIEDIFQFEKIECVQVTPPAAVKPMEELSFLGIAAYLLLNVRLGKLDTRTGSDYAQGIAANLKILMSQVPFDCNPDSLLGYPLRLESFIYRQNDTLKKLAAAIDYFLSNTQCGELLKLRYSTLTTRYEDHAILKYILAAHKFLPNQSATDFATLLVMKRPAVEMTNIFNTADEVSNTCGLLPYSRSLDLISKSVYSLNESPALSTVITALLGLLGKSQFLNVARCDIDVNPFLMLAVKISSVTGTTTEVGEYFYTQEEADKIGRPKNSGPKNALRGLARTIINKLKHQRSILSKQDIAMLKNATLPIAQPRRGSLAEYIRGLPLEFDIPQNLVSEPLAIYESDSESEGSETEDDTLKHIDKRNPYMQSNDGKGFFDSPKECNKRLEQFLIKEENLQRNTHQIMGGAMSDQQLRQSGMETELQLIDQYKEQLSALSRQQNQQMPQTQPIPGSYVYRDTTYYPQYPSQPQPPQLLPEYTQTPETIQYGQNISMPPSFVNCPDKSTLNVPTNLHNVPQIICVSAPITPSQYIPQSEITHNQTTANTQPNPFKKVDKKYKWLIPRKSFKGKSEITEFYGWAGSLSPHDLSLINSFVKFQVESSLELLQKRKEHDTETHPPTTSILASDIQTPKEIKEYNPLEVEYMMSCIEKSPGISEKDWETVTLATARQGKPITQKSFSKILSGLLIKKSPDGSLTQIPVASMKYVDANFLKSLDGHGINLKGLFTKEHVSSGLTYDILVHYGIRARLIESPIEEEAKRQLKKSYNSLLKYNLKSRKHS